MRSGFVFEVWPWPHLILFCEQVSIIVRFRAPVRRACKACLRRGAARFLPAPEELIHVLSAASYAPATDGAAGPGIHIWYNDRSDREVSRPVLNIMVFAGVGFIFFNHLPAQSDQTRWAPNRFAGCFGYSSVSSAMKRRAKISEARFASLHVGRCEAKRISCENHL